MITDSGIIVVSIISMFGFIAVMFLSQYNYFKKKKFNFELGRQRKIDKLKFNQLKKEMKLPEDTKDSSQTNLDLNGIIRNIASNYNNDEEEDEEGGMLEGILGKVVEENPELVSNLLGKITNKNEDQEQEQVYLGQE